MTYGDGLSDVDLNNLYDFHKKNKKLATLTAVQPLARFGALEFSSNGIIKEFIEKPKNSDSWINGGFFVLSEKVTDYVKSNNEFRKWSSK